MVVEYQFWPLFYKMIAAPPTQKILFWLAYLIKVYWICTASSRLKQKRQRPKIKIPNDKLYENWHGDWFMMYYSKIWASLNVMKLVLHLEGWVTEFLPRFHCVGNCQTSELKEKFWIKIGVQSKMVIGKFRSWIFWLIPRQNIREHSNPNSSCKKGTVSKKVTIGTFELVVKTRTTDFKLLPFLLVRRKS